MTTPGYDINAIMGKLAQMKEEAENRGRKIKWAKFDLGSHSVRILPFPTKEGSTETPLPVAEIAFYRQEKMVGQFKVPTAAQYGLPDPIHEFLVEMSKDRSKESWNLRKEINPRTSWFVPILIRGKEEEGVQIWEMNQATMQSIYAAMVHEDWREVNLLDPEKGHDWVVQVTDAGKKFKGFQVKTITMSPRPKPSKLAKTPEETQKILSQVPDLNAIYRDRVLKPEEAQEKLQAFLNAYHADPMTEGATSSEAGRDQAKANGAGTLAEETRQALEDQFADL